MQEMDSLKIILPDGSVKILQVIATDEEYQSKVSTTRSPSVAQIGTDMSNLTAKVDDVKITTVETTAAAVSAGVVLPNNQELIVSGSVNNFVITSAVGAGIVTFVAGTAVNFMLPSGSAWSGGVPFFDSGKIYNVVYYKGSFYADKGR